MFVITCSFCLLCLAPRTNGALGFRNPGNFCGEVQFSSHSGEINWILIVNCCYVLQVWDVNGVSKCFRNTYPFGFLCVVWISFPYEEKETVNSTINCLSLTVSTVLGFGANAVTVCMIVGLGITQRTGRRSWRVGFILHMPFLGIENTKEWWCYVHCYRTLP